MLSNVKENAIREINRSLVLEYIVNEKEVSRAQIANHTGISKPSVSEIVKHLIDLGIIEEVGIGNSSLLGGRKPVLLQLKKDSCFYISIDLGYNYIKLLMTYTNGEKICYREYDNEVIERKMIIHRLRNIIQQAIHDAPETLYGVKAITIGIHGAVLENCIAFTPYYDLTNLPIKEELQKFFQVPVYCENEANLSVIANHALDKTFHNVISISIHSGVGSGIIANDQIYSGGCGFGGEIGHMTLIPNGNACPCGNRGCLETYCSQKAIEEEFSKHFERHVILKDIRALYDNKDSYTIKKMHELAKYLSIGVNNLCVMFDPQIIYFNCTLVCMFPELIQEVKQNLTSFLSNNRLIEISPIAKESILIGGILMDIKRSLLLDHIQLKNLGFLK